MLKIYNTLEKTLSEVQPIEDGLVKMYTCGPTVYRDAHIGNLRSYLMADWIRRILTSQGLDVVHIKNITDVGHMRQEVLERGEDKIIAAAIEEGKTPAEIAEFYTQRFRADEEKLSIQPAHEFPKATDHIDEMLEIVENLIEGGYAYEVDGNVYFEISRFPDYGKLSGNIHEAELLEAVRVDADPLKRDPRDFTLWKAAEPGRTVKWPSPWGEGFPGWHIECSAMSIKYLGDKFDIHTGGVDNIFPHHEGEIAQSEGFTGKPVVNSWIHGQHLLADGVKMAKSAGNSFIMTDIEAQGLDAMAFRYLCMTARYNTRLNFTFTSLRAAQRGLQRLKNRVWQWMIDSEEAAVTDGAEPDGAAMEEWVGRFLDTVNSNLDMPGALALTWEMARSDLDSATKLALIERYDEILGLGLLGVGDEYDTPPEALEQLLRRAHLRDMSEFAAADQVRTALEEVGYVVEDHERGSRIRPKAEWEKLTEDRDVVSAAAEVPSLLDQEDVHDVTIGVVACNYVDDVRRVVSTALSWSGQRDVELVVLDNGSTDETGKYLDDLASSDSRVRVIHADHVLGEAAAKNIVLKQSLGRIVILLDTSVEVTGDLLGPIKKMLSDDQVGVAGPFGLRTDNLHHFHDGDGESGDMDAMQAYCFAIRRSDLAQVGLMRESFRFYRNLDIDYSFHFKEHGMRIVADQSLPVVQHEHRVWNELAEAERDELSLKNYRRFLEKWGERADLLVSNRNS